jgi:uncharacterized protein
VKNIEFPTEQTQAFSTRWQITEFALFASVPRDDSRSDSDVNGLVTFAPDARRGWAKILKTKDELQAIDNKETVVIVIFFQRLSCFMVDVIGFNIFSLAHQYRLMIVV